MAYTAWSVVYGEQPTAAKWNQLGANDAGFKDMTNVDDLAVLTRHLNTSAATTAKVKLTTINFKGAAGSNFTTTSATFTAITGMETSYTSGNTAERVFLWFNCMANNSSASSAALAPQINGVNLDDEVFWYPSGAGEWAVAGAIVIFDIPANTSYNIKGMAKTSGGTLTVNRSASFKLPTIRGFAISNA